MLRPAQQLEIRLASRQSWTNTAYATWLVCLFIPAIVFVAFIPSWSLDLDEIYTLRDSSQSLRQVLGYEKPLYYLLCHVLLVGGLPDAIAIRLPAALAAGCLAPVSFVLVSRYLSSSVGFLASALVATNPWYFQTSQFGRFYSLTVLLSLVAIVLLYGYLNERRWWQLMAAIGCASLATASHTTAVVLFPAGTIAFALAALQRDGMQRVRELRKYLIPATLLGLVALLLIGAGVSNAFTGWINAQHGRYGNYSVAYLVLGFVLFTGLQVWSLALLPLMRSFRDWSTSECFFFVLLFGAVIPLIALSPFGGGVAPRYLLAATPALFILAGQGWQRIDSQLPTWTLRLCVAVIVFAVSVPMALSTLRDGNHCDYQSAVSYVEELETENPIVFCTAHELYRYYAADKADVHELHTLADWRDPPASSAGAVQENLLKQIFVAEATGRPLFLVSREDRRQFDDDVQRWISERFRVLKTIEKPRFDHRRNQMVVYAYQSH